MKRRFFEILPGILSWSLILLPIIMIFIIPKIVIIFFVVYACFWLLKALDMCYYFWIAYKKSKEYMEIDWDLYVKKLKDKSLFSKLDYQINKKNLKHFYQLYDKNYNYDKDIYHLVVIPNYNEEYNVVRENINNIIKSNYDKKKIIILFAYEERKRAIGEFNAKKLIKEYKNIFYDIFTIMHPKNLPNEVVGKGANITWATKKALPIILKKLNPKNIIITTLDTDNNVHKEYFNNLTFHYLMYKCPDNKSFQPLPLYFNNIYKVPLFNRIIGFSSGYWHMIESCKTDRLKNFSSHAQPLLGVIKTDFWDIKTIVEDGRQYWRSYFAFAGDYEVIPLFIPIYQDAVLDNTYIKTLWAQYKQLRRWAWGVTDIPYVFENLYRIKNITFLEKFIQIFRLFEGHISWATAPIIISLALPIPKYLLPNFHNLVLSNHMSQILSIFFTIALVGIFTSIWMTLLFAPRIKIKNIFKKFYLYISLIIQWLILPISTIIYGCIPALDSQTRLMFGKKLEFQVTNKTRK